MAEWMPITKEQKRPIDEDGIGPEILVCAPGWKKARAVRWVKSRKGSLGGWATQSHSFIRIKPTLYMPMPTPPEVKS